MAVAILRDFEGATLDQYDEVVAKMGFVPGDPGADGALFHWATETDNGIRVTDVWESRDKFEAFAAAEIGPRTPEVGFMRVRDGKVAPISAVFDPRPFVPLFEAGHAD